jgi:hypothetical protein
MLAPVVQQMCVNGDQHLEPRDDDLDENLVQGLKEDQAVCSDPVQGRLSQ